MFYILNTLWNYKFWLYKNKICKEHIYEIVDENELLDLNNVDITGKIVYNKKKRVSKRRFIGYLYKNRMYLDNPGIRHLVKKSTWEVWKKKGLIK